MMSQFKLGFKIFILFIIVAVGGWGWFYIHEPDVFPIKSVKMDGRYHYVSPKILEQTVTPFVTQGFFNMNVSKAQAALDKIPGIDEAYVKRIWPGTVDISLREEKAIAKWGNQKVLSQDADIFKPLVILNLSQLPVFQGRRENAWKMLEMYKEIKKVLPRKVKLETLIFKGNQWQIEFKKLPMVRLGNQNILTRLKDFFYYLPIVSKQDPNKKIEYLDMRYPVGFAVGWQKTA